MLWGTTSAPSSAPQAKDETMRAKIYSRIDGPNIVLSVVRKLMTRDKLFGGRLASFLVDVFSIPRIHSKASRRFILSL